MDNTKERVSNYIDTNQDYLIKKIQEAVQIKSLIGKEHSMQIFMKNLYKEIGLKVVEFKPNVEKVSQHKAFIDSGYPLGNRTNVIGIYEGSDEARSVTLHGHVDVVSEEPLQSWTKDPWGGEIIGNNLYGRGSLDMKSGLLANWFAMKTLLDLGIKPKGTIQLHSTIEEEAGGGLGALACFEEGFITDGYITTEPHSLRVTIAHAGVMYFKVRVLGRTAHAAKTQEGINAIGKMIKIYNALEELDIKRAKEVKFDLFTKDDGSQSVNLNLGRLKAGDWVSSVPGEAILDCRIGFIPGETRSQIKKTVEDTVASATLGDAWLAKNSPTIEWFGWSTEPWYQDPEDPFVQSFVDSAEKTLNKKVNFIGRTGGNDARFTQYYNKAGIGFGPRGANAHGPDEYVELDSVLDTAKVLANHIVDWAK